MIPRNQKNEMEYKYGDVLKEFERDKKFMDTSYPSEWEKSFHQEMEQASKRKILRNGIKVLAAVASVLLVIGIFNVTQCQQVQGMNFQEFFSRLFNEKAYVHDLYGTNEEITLSILNEKNDPDLFFEGESLRELLNHIHKELKQPMFYYEDIFIGYNVVEAKYDWNFESLTIMLENDNGPIYINQDKFYGNLGSGMGSENELATSVYNEHLGMDIDIYKTVINSNKQGYIFEVMHDKTRLCFNGYVNLEECMIFAKSIYYE